MSALTDLDATANIPPGALLLFTKGEYSDYCHVGSFVTLQEISYVELREIEKGINDAITLEEEKNGWAEDNGQDLFVAELIRRGMLLDLNIQEIHLGNYSDLNFSPR